MVQSEAEYFSMIRRYRRYVENRVRARSIIIDYIITSKMDNSPLFLWFPALEPSPLFILDDEYQQELIENPRAKYKELNIEEGT